jgi:hypothetical protein
LCIDSHAAVLQNPGKNIKDFLAKIPWKVLVIACLTLGLAPFSPPHIWEKLQMLSEGRLIRPIDWFDLFFHAAPWLLLVLKGVYSLKK